MCFQKDTENRCRTKTLYCLNLNAHNYFSNNTKRPRGRCVFHIKCLIMNVLDYSGMIYHHKSSITVQHHDVRADLLFCFFQLHFHMTFSVSTVNINVKLFMQNFTLCTVILHRKSIRVIFNAEECIESHHTLCSAIAAQSRLFLPTSGFINVYTTEHFTYRSNTSHWTQGFSSVDLRSQQQ
jgi:hypothetical protein